MTKHLLGILFLFFFFFLTRGITRFYPEVWNHRSTGGRDRKEDLSEEKDKKKWQLYWCQTQREQSWIFFLCFCVSGLLFPLNLTVGVWSITEKYLTTKNRWSEMNLCWLDPGRSPGTYLKLDLGEDKCTKKPSKNIFSKKEFVTKK